MIDSIQVEYSLIDINSVDIKRYILILFWFFLKTKERKREKEKTAYL